MVYKIFYKKISGGTVRSEIMPNQPLALHKPIIRKLLHSSFIDKIWGAILADMLLIGKFNTGFRFLLCVIDIYSKYGRVIPLKGKKGTAIRNLKNFLAESNPKPNG